MNQWTNTQDSVVRKAALDAIAKLYDDKENHAGLEYFTKRFLNRFLEMVHDIDSPVATATVEFVTTLLR